ncbi:MAG: hypothetical protein LBU90_07505 [Bacteroidales bacterium]|jgi:hypothetical protein|nr:hypothetical protein [Bacteroidales bacterium]
MLHRLIELEEKRLHALGYDTIVTPVQLHVTDSLQITITGNDSYVLAGIRVSADDVLSNRHSISILSPTACLQGTQQEIATLGTSSMQLFKEYILVKTTDEKPYSGDNAIPPFRLDFLKITPLPKR